ncbi:uncharacterized protein LOC119113931 [Pollicipes pollicipes]|uniref:uncharacterized protein LOC119113931 n=1 Tax=Pollicipes pollicipes TaxID=41117 RepID=UPI001884A167|nr:uncharacterized protein LOC119113931 [Pollicipes pollicipes]
MVSVSRWNLHQLPAVVKEAQIVLLLITITIAQASDSFPGYGVTAIKDAECFNASMIVDGCVDGRCIGEKRDGSCLQLDKHAFFFGAGICMYYLVNNIILVLCYWIEDTTTQSSKYELITSAVGSIFFFALGMTVFVSGGKIATASSSSEGKLIAEGCCCIIVAVLNVVDAIFVARRIREG